MYAVPQPSRACCLPKKQQKKKERKREKKKANTTKQNNKQKHARPSLHSVCKTLTFPCLLLAEERKKRKKERERERERERKNTRATEPPSVCRTLTFPCLLHAKARKERQKEREREETQSQLHVECSSEMLRQIVGDFHVQIRYNMFAHPNSFRSSLLTQEPPWAAIFRRSRQALMRELRRDTTLKNKSGQDWRDHLDVDDDLKSLTSVHDILPL